MSQTEAEMWSVLEKTAENGQVVSSTPIGPYDANAIFDRGWDDLSYFGVPAGYYRGNGAGLSMAIQCADVKARDLSKAETVLYQRSGRGWRMVQPGNRGAVQVLSKKLLTRPNRTRMTWPELWRMTVLHLEISQNSYIYTPRATDGSIEEFIPIMPGRCRMRISDRGNVFYEIFPSTEFDRAMLREDYLIVPEREMIHFRGRLLDGVNGLSSAALGTPIFHLMQAIASYQTKLFGNDGRQPLVFEKKDGFPNSDQGNAAFQRLKQQLREAAARAGNYGEAILLEDGMTAKSIAINAKDAATPESFTQQVMRMCGLMDVPPHRIYALESVAYNNMASMERHYVRNSLIPVANNIEIKLRNHILDDELWSDYSIQFDRAELISNDPETLDKLVKTGMMYGLMNFNEGREIMPFRLNPLANGGDQRMVPVNMSLIDSDGNVVQAGVGQNATNPGAGQTESPDNNAEREDQEEEAEKGIRLIHNSGAA